VSAEGGRRPLAIVAVNYGSSGLLERNLVRSAARAAPASVVVVDNPTSSEERTRVQALAAEHGWLLVEPEENLGFGGGANAGAQRAIDAGAQDLLLLNPDATLGEGCVPLLRAADPMHDAVCAPQIVTSGGAVWFDGADLYLDDGITRGRAKRRQYPASERWEWLTGACLWVPVEIWTATGGFYPEYFLYWEDVDFSRRVVEAGGMLRVVSAARAVHDEGGTQGRAADDRTKSEMYYYFNIRNRMLFATQHLGQSGVRRWARTAGASAREILLRGGRRQFLFSLAPWRGGFRGLRDARRIARRSQIDRRGYDLRVAEGEGVHDRG